MTNPAYLGRFENQANADYGPASIYPVPGARKGRWYDGSDASRFAA
jgi:hypothetical protein